MSGVEITSSYVPPPTLSHFNSVTRWGHTSDITSILKEDGNASDYVFGTIFIAGFCLAVLIIWIVVCIILKIARKGITAGHPFQEPRRHTIFRTLMLLASVIIFLTGVVYFIMGPGAFANTLDDFREGTNGLESIFSSIVTAVDQALALGNNAVTVRDSLITGLSNVVCNPTGDNAVGEIFQETIQEVLDIANDLGDFSADEFTHVGDAFTSQLNSIVDTLNDGSDLAEEYVRLQIGAIPIIVLGFFLIVGNVIAWKGKHMKSYFAFQTWIIMPILFILVTLLVIISSIAAVALVMNSDTCLGGESKSPEGVVHLAMENGGFGPDVKEVVEYYIVSGCKGEGQYLDKAEIEAFDILLQSFVDTIQDLRDIIRDNSAEIEFVCGTGEFLNDLDESLGESLNIFDEFLIAVDGAVDALACEKVNAVFVLFYHDALCTTAPSTLTWAFICSVIVGMCGMFIYLCRGAMLSPIPAQMINDESIAARDKAAAYGGIGDDAFDKMGNRNPSHEATKAEETANAVDGEVRGRHPAINPDLMKNSDDLEDNPRSISEGSFSRANLRNSLENVKVGITKSTYAEKW